MYAKSRKTGEQRGKLPRRSGDARVRGDHVGATAKLGQLGGIRRRACRSKGEPIGATLLSK